MKMLLVFGILLDVSLLALGGLVEVYEGVESVLLPCQYSDALPEANPSVLWIQEDLNPKVILRRTEQGDDHRHQNQRYSGRTSMNRDALDTGNFSLALRKPHLSDNGTYTCSISDGRAQLKLTQVQLKVKDNPVEVKVNEHAESVILPCKTFAGLKEDTRVEWTRSDSDFKFVHLFSNTSKHNTKQDDHYCGRTKMNVDLLRTGDLSLTLKFPTDRDSGSYICTVYRDEDILRQRVILHHITQELFLTWTIVLSVCGALLFIAAVTGCFFCFKHNLKTVNQVNVDSGAESVLLPFRLPIPLHRNVTVEWTDSNGKKVYVYSPDLDCSKEQDEAYKGRTEMNKNLLKFGVCSLTLKYPVYRDRNTYTCTIYRKGKKPIKKQVMLDVKVHQVNMDSGAEYVILPFETSGDLPEDAKVEWKDNKNWTVHVFQNGSDQPHQQHWYYKGRTEMKTNPLKDKDLSLTVKHLTESDFNTCTIYNNVGKIILKREFALNVKVFQVEVEPGVESVQLPFKTMSAMTHKNIEVEWTNSHDRKVHIYRYGSDQHEDQFCSYRSRTVLNKDLLDSGDFSLTLKCPTHWDNDIYTCKVYGPEGTILVKKRVELNVKECEVEIQLEDRLVQLPFRTVPDLLEDSTVEWLQVEPKYRIVHMLKKRSGQPEEHKSCSNRTKMNENLLETGDLTLTLEHPTEDDLGKYKCIISGKQGRIFQEKTVQVQMKGTFQIQDQPHSFRVRNNFIDPTPLMPAHQV